MYGTGKAQVSISKARAGGLEKFKLVYTTGEYGVDDAGSILIARRSVSDAQLPQFDDPNKPGFVSVCSDADVLLETSYVTSKYIRPWEAGILIKVRDGSLFPGEKIIIEYGSSAGSGYRMQTFTEKRHIFRVLVDCAGSGNFYDIDDQPEIEITSGPVSMLEVVCPSVVVKGEKTTARVRAMDYYGNVSEDYCEKIKLEACGEYEVDIKNGTGEVQVVFEEETSYYPKVYFPDGRLAGRGNPVLCKKQKPQKNLYWGDMHGQTGETVGTGTPDLYFLFARDKAFMDFCAWQGNDFQVTDELWETICKKSKEYNEEGKFVVFPGYEWSGTTPVGGDYNVYFNRDNPPIHRSYHWQIDMNKRDGSERTPINKLWEEFDGDDTFMATPHVGGRYGNLDYWNDKCNFLLEVHSHHGTFDWLLEDALKKGLKPGVWANSDDHTCRPGLSYPTRPSSRGKFVTFDVNGGYAGVLAENLSRGSLWSAFRLRHCYGTTGKRIYMSVTSGEKMMGDEFATAQNPRIDVEVHATSNVAEIEVHKGVDVVYRYGSELEKKKDSMRIQWSGVRVRSRSKKARWEGNISVKNGSIICAKEFAFNQPDEYILVMSGQQIAFKSATSGDIDGVDIELEWNEDTVIEFASNQGTFEVKAAQILEQDGRQTKDAGGVNQKVEFFCTPNAQSCDAVFAWEDEQAQSGKESAYWVKVIEDDGGMAWSSPMYITKE